MTTPNAGEDKEETGSLLHWCWAYKIIQILWKRVWQFPIKLMVLAVKSPSANAENLRDLDLIPGLGRSSGEGSGNPLQYSCLENPMDRGAWRATFHRVTHDWSNLAHKQNTCLQCNLAITFLGRYLNIFEDFKIEMWHACNKMPKVY